MDNLVLTRIAIELGVELRGSVLERLRQHSAERFRLDFASDGRVRTLSVSLHAEEPWIGESINSRPGPRWSPEPFFVAASRALFGRRLAGVSKAPADRSIRFDFGEGAGLALELATHGANAVLLGPGGTIEAAFRQPKRDVARLALGKVWEPRPVPEGKLDPFSASADAIDAFLRERTTDGRPTLETLRRDLLGIGTAVAEVVLAEAEAHAETPGVVLRDRLDALLAGKTEVVIERTGGPEAVLREHILGKLARGPRGVLSEAEREVKTVLLPWRSGRPLSPSRVRKLDSATKTAAMYYESFEWLAGTHLRIEALRGILRNELRRTRTAAAKVREAQASFADPERHTRMGEALLAGLTSARRSGDLVFVPDLYDPEGRDVAIPAPAGRPLTKVADDLFQKSRRARRGREMAASRSQALAERERRLEKLDALGERTSLDSEADELEAAMRAERLPVGLLRPTKAGQAAARAALPKLEGIRMLESADGWSILVGRTGRDNDRLTFKIAAPEDIWLHAGGVPGAHVVIRNPERASRVPEGTFAEAAGVAAWFSDAKFEGFVDVHWTRRKYVRRAKGGGSGKVVLKRFETIRVRPSPPSERE